MPSVAQVLRLFLLALPALSSPVDERHEFDLFRKNTCNRDNLLRCFDPTAASASPTRASATAFCSSYLSIPVVTSTVSIITSTTTTATVTAYTTTLEPLTTTLAPLVKKSTKTSTNLLACAVTYPASQISSACSCLSITPSTQLVTALSTTTILATTTTTDIITSTATPVPTCTPGVNLITNPGFESGLDPWSEYDYGNVIFGVQNTGYDSGHSFILSTTASGYIQAFLTQPITGLIPGVTYTFSYMYQYESITNDYATNTWLAGPSDFGSTFVAGGTGGTLSCGFFSSSPQTWWLDDLYIGC
ncbi:hypothetical protein N431DRAFT_24191 [Stipitochalara longipes BDJ]|nr:hypothetical protein N431DRAFT_24191 [Stipitochalara longipes BDJ]